MIDRLRLLIPMMVGLVMAATAGAQAQTPAGTSAESFEEWLAGLRAEAIQLGIRVATVDRALAGATLIERAIKQDRSQPEFTQTFAKYFYSRVSQKRIERGRALLQKHAGLLGKVHARYGVQPRFLVAFWGLETNFGDYFGKYPLVSSLATLSYEGRRGPFFRAQLLALLQIIDQGDIGPDVAGSWAGAMGHLQFMPITYREYAIDMDGDNKRDLWNSLPDVFGSASNYLSGVGWDGSKTWGREVKLPAGFDFELARLNVRKSLAEWQTLGVRRADGRDLPKVDIEGAIVLPGGHTGPAFVVYRNFRKIMVWNGSIFYALSVGHLADRIAGRGGLLVKPSRTEKPLLRTEVMEIQTLLAAKGHDGGAADGIVGAKTRAAVRAYQKTAGMVPDGYPTAQLLDRLRAGN